jgi:hypothetical protein
VAFCFLIIYDCLTAKYGLCSFYVNKKRFQAAGFGNGLSAHSFYARYAESGRRQERGLVKGTVAQRSATFCESYTAERDGRHYQVTSFVYHSTEALWQSSAADSHGLMRGIF